MNTAKLNRKEIMKYQFYSNGHTIELAAISARGEIVNQHKVAEFTPGFYNEQKATVQALNTDLNARKELSRKELDFSWTQKHTL